MGETEHGLLVSLGRESVALAWQRQRHWRGHVRYSLILTTASAHHEHPHRLAVLRSTM
jgi:hypothetical protein